MVTGIKKTDIGKIRASCKERDNGLPFLMMIHMQMGMRVRLTLMAVAMYMYEVIRLKQ